MILTLGTELRVTSSLTCIPVPVADAVFIISPVASLDTSTVKVYSTYLLSVPSLASNEKGPAEKIPSDEILGAPYSPLALLVVKLISPKFSR